MDFVNTSGFDSLSPQVVLQGVELTYGLSLEPSLTPYPSYVNRVYGVRDIDGNEYIAKFYRPQRWTEDAILEEHQFLRDCVDAEMPVAAPIPDPYGETLAEVTSVAGDQEIDFLFALFPKRGGRLFDAETDEAWVRMGQLLGRMHKVGSERPAPNRAVCTPPQTTERHVEELLSGGLVHPDSEESLRAISTELLGVITPLFEETATLQRIHGDCHRGNILDRPGDGLLLIDFDDMMEGPVVQDMWLLLPDHVEKCRRQLVHLIDGYEQFRAFDRRQLRLVEPLRFMRMIHYAAWCSRQRFDRDFDRFFPDWGTRAYWLKEIDDLRQQRDLIMACSAELL